MDRFLTWFLFILFGTPGFALLWIIHDGDWKLPTAILLILIANNIKNERGD